MRQLRDAAILDRTSPEVVRQTSAMIDALVHDDPLKRPHITRRAEKQVYVRGALVKSSKRDNRK